MARWTGALAVLATFTVALTASTAAAATAVPPTISTQYTPNQIGVTQTSGITYTITNPNASGSLYQVGFTDTLPSTSAVDNPATVSTSQCGSGATVAAVVGASTVSVSGVQVKAGAPCTVSVAIVGKTAGTASDAFSNGLYTSSSNPYAIPGPIPSSDETPASLQVIGLPTITVSAPKAKAVYRYGQVVKARYRCAAAAGDEQSQLTCAAIDDLGNAINSGQALDTKVAGKHELDIQAISGITGASSDTTVDYTVLPDNEFTIAKLKASNGTIRFSLALPGAGKAVVRQVSGRKAEPGKTFTVRGKKTLSVTLAGIAGASSETLQVSYTPKGGVKRTVTKHLTL